MRVQSVEGLIQLPSLLLTTADMSLRGEVCLHVVTMETTCGCCRCGEGHTVCSGHVERVSDQSPYHGTPAQSSYLIPYHSSIPI